MADETQTAADPAPILPPVVDPVPPGAQDLIKPEPLSFKPFVSRTAPSTAKERLRAFEDKHLGKDAARIGGQVERGHGSAFKALSPELHAEYAAIEKLIEAEAKVDDAKVSLETAKAELAIAQSAVVKA